MKKLSILLVVDQFQNYLLGTCYVRSEMWTKPELSVGISNKTVRHWPDRRMLLCGSKVSDTWVVLRRWWDGNVWKAAADLCTGRTGRWWMCSDPETSEMKPSLKTEQCELVSTVPFAEMCMLGRQWVAVMTGFRQPARLKGKRRGVVRRGRKTKGAQVTGWDRSSKRG